MLDKNIVFFDGICNLCSGAVQFFISIDKKQGLRFSSLQATYGQEILKKHNLSTSDFESFLFLKDDKLFSKSDAALEVFRTIGGFWKILYGFKLIPKPIRNFIYDKIATNRYRWFGKKESCWLPTPELKARFL